MAEKLQFENGKNSKNLNEEETATETLTVAETIAPDTKKLLEILPEEIWLQVFDTVKDPDDLANFLKTCEFFHRLLYPRRADYLLPQVLQIMAPYLRTKKSFQGLRDIAEDINASLEEYYHHRANWLPSKNFKLDSTLLQLRLVQKSWKHSVDHFFQSNIQNQVPKSVAKLVNKYTFKCSDLTKLENFLAHFENTHGSHKTRNPFIGRVLVFEDEKLNELTWEQKDGVYFQHLWDRFTDLLNKYGHHLWHSSIKIQDNFSTTVEYVRHMRKWLKLMPNLKSLEIQYSKSCQKSLLNVSTKLSPVRWGIIKLEPAANPFPNLEHLQFLKTECLPAPVFNNLLAQNAHIVSLEVARKEENGEYVFNVMPNLEHLSLQVCSNAHVQQLNVLAPQWQNLTKLHLPYKPDKPINLGEWQRYLDVISNNWGKSKTLVDLVIELPLLVEPETEYLRRLAQLNLELPLVKRLKIIMNTPCTLDFLLSVKNSLENLDVIAEYNTRYSYGLADLRDLGQNERVQWLGFENRIYDSNIWQLFPNLNKITIEVGSDIREYFRQNIDVKLHEENFETEGLSDSEIEAIMNPEWDLHV